MARRENVPGRPRSGSLTAAEFVLVAELPLSSAIPRPEPSRRRPSAAPTFGGPDRPPGLLVQGDLARDPRAVAGAGLDVEAAVEGAQAVGHVDEAVAEGARRAVRGRGEA